LQPGRLRCCLIALFVAAGCGAPVAARMEPPAQGEADAGDSEPESPPRPDAAQTTRPDSRSAPPDSAGSEPDARPDAGAPDLAVAEIWARGVRVGLVEAAQAVFVKLGDAGMVLPSIDRNAPIIEHRALFLRAHVITDSGWAPRKLRAVLTLSLEGAPMQLEDSRMIAGPSDTEKLESSFNFLVPAAMVQPRTELSVAVYEIGPASGPEPATPPRFPRTGTADLGVRAGKMVMDVVLVPVLGPSGKLDDSLPRRKRLESYLADVYPVQKMNVRWREPLVITAKIAWMDAFKKLQQAREDDGAKPAEYYHLLMAKEDSSDGFLGLGRVAGPAASEGPNRIAMTNVSNHAVDSEMDTVSHEMGHNLGRQHAPGCNAQGVDTHYPYPDTGVGVDGYSIPEAAFKSRKKWKDVMGYCYPTWISDYTWNGLESRVRVVSTYSTSPFQPLPAHALQGFYAPGTRPVWGRVRGTLVSEEQAVTTSRRARIILASGEERIVAIDVSRLLSPAGPEDGARQVSVNLPDEEIASVEVTLDGDRFVVPPDVLAP
jgi:hypothetical protein